MPTCIHDQQGVLMEAQYEMTGGMPTISSVRVLGENYAPTGPNLVTMLNYAYAMTAPGEVTYFLSLITESIHASEETG